MQSKKKILGILCIVILVSVINNVWADKSVYVISNTDGKEIQAYKVDANSLAYQTTAYTNSSSNIGLTIHESDYGKWLFCTFEGSDKIELINAKTMVSDGKIYVPYATNLAGVVMDTSNSKLYAVDRNTNHLYSYSWDPSTKTLINDFGDPYYVQLEDTENAFGIALDEENELLYVADNTNDVKYYDTNDWSKEGEITVSCEVIGIAIDIDNQLLYIGSMGGGYGQGDPNLYQYDISSQIENSVVVGSSVAGIAVAQETGYVYCTTFSDGFTSTHDRLYVYDANLVQQWVSDELGSPAGVTVAEVGYKFPLFDIVKDDNDVNCVGPLISDEANDIMGADYNWLYYNIAWDANGYADSNVVVVDYLPIEVNEPNMISDGGVYDSNMHRVTWDIGSLGANDSNEFQIRVGVNRRARPGGVISNRVEIEGDEYLSWYIVDTNVCAWGTEIIYVDEDANGFNNGTCWEDAYNDLQDGFAGACNCGAEVTDIWVAGGTYKPTQNVGDSGVSFDLVEDVGVFGHFSGTEKSVDQRDFSDSNNVTILEGQIGTSSSEAVKYVVKAMSVENTLVDGFTIRNSYDSGAGVYINDANVAIANCKIKNNNKYGIQAINYSNCDIHNCLFKENTSQNINVVEHCNPIVSYCSFDGNNVTADGINISSYTVLDVQKSVFKSHIDNGIEVENSDLTIDHSVIAGSTDNGLYMETGCNLTFGNSIIRYSGEHGIYLSDNVATTIINSWIHNNGTDNRASKGSGFYSSKHTTNTLNLRNNTIYDNYSYGIECGEYGADPYIRNCIIAGNDSNDLYRVNGDFSRVNYCLLQNSHAGTGNITGDPGLMNVEVDPNDLHIDVNSQCKDAGDPNGSYDELDIDGENRIYYGCVDIGADEYYLSLADFDNDGIVNFVDYAILANAWGSEPNDDNYDEKFDLVDNNSIGVSDLSAFSEDWLWEKGWENAWMMAMDGGVGSTLKSSAMMESSLFGVSEFSIDSAVEKSGDGLMLSAVESLARRPERLAVMSQKFYDVTADTTITAKQQTLDAIKAESVDIKEVLEWLDELWANGEIDLSKKEYREFRKAIEKSDGF